MAEKKISFGFSKSIKPKMLSGASAKNDNGIELIKCLEEQTIKIIGEVKKEETPLIIPLKNSTKTSAALAALQTLKDTLEGKEAPAVEHIDNQIVENNEHPKTLEQQAAQEILNGLKEHQEMDGNPNKLLTLPLKVDDLPLDGAAESTLDDYAEIPISQFGLAMLRGMGFKDEVKSEKKIASDDLMVRPKGLGLGADKMVKPKTLLVAPAKDEVLVIKKSACVRILLGKHKDMYGVIESLDEHSGRSLVKLALGGTKEWFNEFMIQPVSKAEYAQYGKVLNHSKYEEYKKKQDEKERLDSLKFEGLGSSSKSMQRHSQQKDSSSSDYETKAERIGTSTSAKYQQYSDKHSNRRRNYSTSDEDEDSKYSEKGLNRHLFRKYSSQEATRNRSIASSRRRSHSSDSDDRGKYSSSHKKTKSKKHFKSRSYSKDQRQRYNSSDDNDKHYKKKTKKSKRPRSRSRDRR